MARHSAVAGEGEPHPAHAGDRRQATQPHRNTNDDGADVREPLITVQVLVNDVQHRW